MENNKLPEVILIGGVAVQTRAYPTLCQIGEWFLNEQYNTQFIDGADMTESGITAISPQEQARRVKELVPEIDNPRKKILYITHCLGMAAAVQLMAEDCGNSSLVALSPSLPSPQSTISQPHFQKNIATSPSGEKLLPAYSWSDEPFRPTRNPSRIDAVIPSGYFEDIIALNPSFSKSVESLEERGRIKLVIPWNDWNVSSIAAAKSFSDIMHVNANHSLLDREFSNAPDALYHGSSTLRLISA